MISLKETLNQIGVKIGGLTTNMSNIRTLMNDVPHRTLLWTNPRPTNSFSSQTITLSQSLSNFDAYEILYSQATSGDGKNRLMSQSSLVGYGFILMCPITNNRFRASSGIPSGTSMAFEGGSWQTSINNASVDNTVCVPYKVFGIKYGGVLSSILKAVQGFRWSK